MKTLLVDDVEPRLHLWSRHLERYGLEVTAAASDDAAFAFLKTNHFDAMVLNMSMPNGAALAIADYAIFQLPKVCIVAVTSDRFFSDGSLFQLIPNLRSHVTETVPMADLSQTLHHFASA